MFPPAARVPTASAGRLNEEEWQRWGTHVERGRTTVAELALHMAGHEARHIDQIKAILAR